MSKNINTSRKRTVTIVMGPLTWKWLEYWGQRVSGRVPGVEITPTDIVGGMVTTSMEVMMMTNGDKRPVGWRSHYD